MRTLPIMAEEEQGVGLGESPCAKERLRLCDFLDHCREAILQAWESELRETPQARPLSSPALRDHIPEILEKIVGVVRSVHTGQPASLGDLSTVHALQRLDLGFDLRSVVSELALLRKTIIRLYRTRARGRDGAQVAEEIERLNGALDDVLESSVAAYAASRERTLVALDRISAAALGTGDLDSFLPKLLGVLLETTEAADFIAIFLREEERLVMKAAAGVDGAESPSVLVGEGFAGEVAARRTPVLVRPTSIDSSDGTGAARVFYGVPIIHDGQVVGVATMGSRSAYDFSDDDKQLFRAMAQRATSIIVQGKLIAERHRAMDAIEHGDAIAVFDREWRFVLVNASAERIIGKSRKELLGQNHWDMFPELRDSDTHYWREYQRCMTERVPVSLEDYYAPLDLWTSVTGYPTSDGGMAVFFRDITGRKKMEAALKASEAERERFFQLAPDMLCIADLNGMFRRVNPAFSSTLGWTEDELLARPLFDFIHPEDAEDSRTEMKKLAQGKATLRFDNRYRRKDGEYRWISWAATPAPDVGLVYAAARDVTEQRASEAATRESAEFAPMLMGIVSHDLRSPLTAMIASASTVLRRKDIDERLRSSVTRIVSSGDRANRLIRDLLDLTQAHLGGGIPVNRERVNVCELIEQVVEEVRLSYPGRDVELHLDFCGDAQWAPDRVAQIVANLVGNALQHSPPNTPVKIETRDGGDLVQLVVSNDGAPIPPSSMKTLFKPFRRGDGAHEADGSVGLGLYITDQLVAAHGGTIEVESSAAMGTKFVVSLPKCRAGSAVLAGTLETGGHH